MANYELLGLNESTPQAVAPTASDTASIAGNLGLGVTPAAWFTGNSFRALQLTNSASVHGQLAGGTFLTGISNNWYADSGGSDKYIANGFASQYRQWNGGHSWLTAPSGTAGNAITFTEKARIDSDGLKFNGDTAAANALDDYEEGTWTPTDGSGAGLSLTVTNARYTKVGNTVFVTATITYPATASGASASISGLPFAIGAGATAIQSPVSSNAFADKGLFVGGVSKIYLYPAASSAQASNAQLSGALIEGISGTYTV